jgi:HprK-related kinase A
MRVSDYDFADLFALASSSGLRYQTGNFTARLRTQNAGLVETFQTIYQNLPLLDHNTICQYCIQVESNKELSQRFKPQAIFTIDGHTPFEPYPFDHAFPMLEWGLNWCIGTTANQYLLLHSAVVEKNGYCLILPATPGSGKSTLSSALACSGWRLLSDEFGVIAPQTDHKLACDVLPLPRAIPLKNESIDIIRQFDPKQTMGPVYLKTRKGTVCHLAPPGDSILRQTQSAKARWIVFPKYQQGSVTELIPEDKAVAFTRLSNNSFNYKTTMQQGFQTLAALIHNSDCYRLPNGDLNEAVALLNTLAEQT